jgi:hypothetical protein
MSGEQYTGVKFTTVFRNRITLQHRLLDELRMWCQLFDEKGLAPPYPGGSYGNLSFRTGSNSFIITGTAIGLKDALCNESFVEVTACQTFQNKVMVNGLREPSSESMLHYTIYSQRPDVNAVFHGHCTELMENAALLNIQVTEKEAPYGSVELAESVGKLVNSDFFILRNHGFVSLGRRMKEAGQQAVNMIERVKK